MANRDVAQYSVIGTSENDRPIIGVTLGNGPRKVSVIAGCHADEPVGPETIRTLIVSGLRQKDSIADLLSEYTFVLVPHVNPDGESRNRPWMRDWPDPVAYLRDVVREEPGRDVEFGFPGLRKENKAVARFLEKNGPFQLHMSLHGMGFAEGGSLLINRSWSFRSASVREGFERACASERLGLHDHNRFGEKGFFYLGPGFSTTPDSDAMRKFFLTRGDQTVAAGFRMSSMEYVESLGDDPLCIVTEVPLFTLAAAPSATPGTPATYLDFKSLLPDLQKKVARKKSIDDALARFFVQPVPLRAAMKLQVRTIELGLEAVTAATSGD
ncbi:MAG: peptidase M14 [Bacteroidetes bacterium]|nr:peptidase M14 [Bacteroidota bacterium]